MNHYEKKLTTLKIAYRRLNDRIKIILKNMLETRERKERMLQAESAILHLQSTIDKNLQLEEEINLELGRMNQELYYIFESEKIVADLAPKYQEYIQKRQDLIRSY